MLRRLRPPGFGGQVGATSGRPPASPVGERASALLKPAPNSLLLRGGDRAGPSAERLAGMRDGDRGLAGRDQIRGLGRCRADFAVDHHLIVTQPSGPDGDADDGVLVEKRRVGQIAHRAPDQSGLLDRADRNRPVRHLERLPPGGGRQIDDRDRGVAQSLGDQTRLPGREARRARRFCKLARTRLPEFLTHRRGDECPLRREVFRRLRECRRAQAKQQRSSP